MRVLELRLLTVKYYDNYYWVLSNGAILIVNDDPDIAELFAAGLENGGFKTIICNDALSAVEKIRSSPDQFSLVLVDRTSQQDTDFPKQVKKINNKMKVVLASTYELNIYMLLASFSSKSEMIILHFLFFFQTFDFFKK